MAQTKRVKKIFSVLGKDRKQTRNLDVTSPPPEAIFTTTDRKKALERLKEFKTKFKVVKFLERKNATI